MSRLFSTFVLASALLCGTAANAQSTSEDVRCLLASNVFAKAEKDPGKQKTAVAAHFFYLGRIDGKLTPAQLKAEFLAQGKTLDPASLGTTMTACAVRLRDRSAAVETIGASLDQAAKK